MSEMAIAEPANYDNYNRRLYGPPDQSCLRTHDRVPLTYRSPGPCYVLFFWVGCFQAFGSFCRAVGSWHDPDPDVVVPPELHEAFRGILQVRYGTKLPGGQRLRY